MNGKYIYISVCVGALERKKTLPWRLATIHHLHLAGETIFRLVHNPTLLDLYLESRTAF